VLSRNAREVSIIDLVATPVDAHLATTETTPAPARQGMLSRLIAVVRRSEAQILDDVIKHPTRRTL